MDIAYWLWDSLHDQFDTDDGSLPDIYLRFQNASGIGQTYALLRDRAVSVVTKNPYFWSVADAVEVPLGSVPNAAEMVVSGTAESFHVSFGGIQALNTTIPDLGVFVFSDQISLDYEMGPHWTPEKLEALFQLLVEIRYLDPKLEISLDESWPEEVQMRFRECWSKFQGLET